MDLQEKVEITKKIKVQLTTEVMTHNGIIKPNGYCCIVFYNQGTTTALLMDTIQVIPGASHEFNFDSNEVIDTPMAVSFSGTGSNNLAVTKIYKYI